MRDSSASIIIAAIVLVLVMSTIAYFMGVARVAGGLRLRAEGIG